MNDQDDSAFVVPKLPVKKPNSAINTLTPIPDDYVPPSWAEIPQSSNHILEVMNNGVISKRIVMNELTKKSYLTVGRMDTCDIQASIPGASRLHCYLQFGDGFEGRGWYVFDKASTQGTFVNKKEVPKGVYYKAKSGSIIQITKSNFHLFLDGDDEKSKPEQTNEETIQFKSPTNFIDELKAQTERSFEKDPVGVLSRFCEREGLEFKFSKLTSDEKDKCYRYAFDLPDDVCMGNGGSFNGQGSEAVSAQKACAFEVCCHLNELGLLGSETQRSARKNIEDNEFYEEDDDIFYDRTGQIEAQRLKRIERHKATHGIKDKALTYPELLNKIKQLEGNLNAVSEQLQRLVKPEDGAKISPDEIDTSALNASLSIRLEISKLKRKHEQLSGEIAIMRKAADIAKPTVFNMPTTTKKSRIEVPDVQPSTSEVRAISPEPLKSLKTEAPKAKKTTERPIYGLLTRKDLQENKKAKLNKRKIAEDVIDEMEDEKRNRTDEFEKDIADVVDWTPPKNQTGDGRTALNDKLGY